MHKTNCSLGVCLGLIIGFLLVDSDFVSAENPAKVNAAQNMAAASNGRITSEYLKGEWCYTHYEAGGEREAQGINIVFHNDGTLLTQNSSTAEMDRKGTYKITEKKMKIFPTLVFAMTIKSVSDDAFVLTGMGDHHFQRGGCH